MPHPVRVVKGIFAKSEGMRPMQVVENAPPALFLMSWSIVSWQQP